MVTVTVARRSRLPLVLSQERGLDGLFIWERVELSFEPLRHVLTCTRRGPGATGEVRRVPLLSPVSQSTLVCHRRVCWNACFESLSLSMSALDGRRAGAATARVTRKVGCPAVIVVPSPG